MSGSHVNSEKASSTTEAPTQSVAVQKVEEMMHNAEQKQQAAVGCVVSEQEKSSTNDPDSNGMEKLDPFEGLKLESKDDEESSSGSSEHVRRMNTDEFNREFQNLVWQKHLMGTQQYEGLLEDLFLQVAGSTEETESSHKFINPTAQALMDFCNGDESDGIKAPLEKIVSLTNRNATEDSHVLGRDDTENVTEYYDIHKSSTVITVKSETKSVPYALVTDEECNHSDRISIEEYNAQHKLTVQSDVKTRPSRSIVEQFSVSSKKKNKQRSWMCWSCYPRRRSSTPNTTLGRISYGSEARPTNGAEENDLPLISEKKETTTEQVEKDVGVEAAEPPLTSEKKEEAVEQAEKDVIREEAGKSPLISDEKEKTTEQAEKDAAVEAGEPQLISEEKEKTTEQAEKDVAVEAGEPQLISEEKEKAVEQAEKDVTEKAGKSPLISDENEKPEELAEKDVGVKSGEPPLISEEKESPEEQTEEDEGVAVSNPTLICERKEKLEEPEKDVAVEAGEPPLISEEKEIVEELAEKDVGVEALEPALNSEKKDIPEKKALAKDEAPEPKLIAERNEKPEELSEKTVCVEDSEQHFMSEKKVNENEQAGKDVGVEACEQIVSSEKIKKPDGPSGKASKKLLKKKSWRDKTISISKHGRRMCDL